MENELKVSIYVLKTVSLIPYLHTKECVFVKNSNFPIPIYLPLDGFNL